MRDQPEVLLEREIGQIKGDADGRVSLMASMLRGSEILKIAADIRTMVAEGKEICNLTVGDFSPAQFRIPELLEHSIKEALTKGETNYPPSDGVNQLKKSVQTFYRERLDLDYSLDSIVITGGSRPGIYATYATLIDPGDVVVYPVPSWNNNHYCHLTRALARPVICGPRTDFLPTRALLEDAVEGARLIALCSPLNPTGTAFSEQALVEICDLVLEENERRKKSGKKPLYVMYDQVYWMLTFGSIMHVHPVGVRPEMADYTIYVDGISKAFAATGVRVGWTIGPKDVVRQMSDLLGHVGAWAPRAEQIATAEFLDSRPEVAEYAAAFKAGVYQRLDELHTAMVALSNDGFPVKTIAPMGAIYLTVQFALIGTRTPSGVTLTTNEEIRQYLLKEAQVALVPFQAFGSQENTGWFRMSVGAVSVQEIQSLFGKLKQALAALT